MYSKPSNGWLLNLGLVIDYFKDKNINKRVANKHMKGTGKERSNSIVNKIDIAVPSCSLVLKLQMVFTKCIKTLKLLRYERFNIMPGGQKIVS
jgi:hypothetical protein